MPTPSKPDLAVTALLQNLNEEIDRKKRKKMDDRMLAKMQSSVRGRLGPRINEQDAQISQWRGGGQLCGAIFMCNRRTWKECLGQRLFGLPIGKKSLVEQVIPGMRLFLFEYERRQLWGVFEAASYGALDIIPNAYSGGSFPCQVRVTVPEECVALYEEEFCEAIRDNYFSHEKFHFDLSEKQVRHLTSLFERKYICANMMHSNLLKYEDERDIYEGCKPNDRLPLLTNDATCLYPEDLLQHSWYSSSCQLTNGPLLLNSEEGVEHFYTNRESRIGRKSSESGSLVPLPNGALEIVQSNVASLPGELGKGFHTVNASCLTCYDSDNYSIVEDFVTGDMTVFPENVSRLHSDRPIAKSVWARISGRSKALVALEPTQAKKSPAVNPVLMPPPKVCTISEMDVADDSDVCRADVNAKAAEKFSVGFKRRRASNHSASVNVNETPSKRRRKITRPSFEASADEHLVESAHDVCQANTLDLNLPVDASIQSEQGVAIVLDKSLALKVENLCATDVTAGQVSGNAEEKRRIKLDQHIELLNETGPNSSVCEMRQESCSLALTLATQETGLLQSRQGIDDSNPADSTGHLQKQPQASALVEDIEQNKPLLVDEPNTFIAQSKQGGRADGECVVNGTDFSGKEKQGSDLQQAHSSSECTSLDYVAADSSRTSLFNLAPCTPAKDFLDRYSVSEQCDDGKGFSHDMVQDIPLTLELGNGAQLPDVKLHLQDIVPPEHSSDNSCKKDAVVLDESSNGNQSKESDIISLDCTSGSNLLNQVDLKSFLSGLQVSGIKLQLGASPCLILQLGDLAGSTSNVDSQDQGGATPGQPESR